VGDYLNLEGPKGEMQDIGSSGRIQVTTHGDKTEDVEILETSEVPTEIAPLPITSTEHTDKPSAETAFTETPASEVPPQIEV